MAYIRRGGHSPVNSLYQLLLACLRHDAERQEVEPMSKYCTNLAALYDCLANRSQPTRADNHMMDGEQPETVGMFVGSKE